MTNSEYGKILSACKKLKDFKDYRMYDYICILFNTVLDFQMKTPVVAKAFKHYRENHWKSIRTHSDLKRVIDKYPNTKKCNTILANHLWGNNHWSRAKLLRSLLTFFESKNIRGFKSLKKWIRAATFEDIKSEVRVIDKKTDRVIHSIGPVLFEWLRLRLGEKTIKADIHIKKFIKEQIGRVPKDNKIIACLITVAETLDVEPRELDAAIWHHMSGY